MNTKLKVSVFTALAALLLSVPSVKDMSTLTEITKPHQGVYRLNEFRFGGEDIVERFETSSIELKRNGQAVFVLNDTNRGRKEVTGEYSLNEESGELILTIQLFGTTLKKQAYLKNGLLTITHVQDGRTIYSEFKRN
ncbi:MAG: hypothetical protein IJV80_02650 [Clostridia bacterium]|nr:hypothetical protein [Clostridia bacterium]